MCYRIYSFILATLHSIQKKKNIFQQAFVCGTYCYHEKHSNESYFLPCSNISTNEDHPEMLTNAKINFKKAVIFRTVASDLSHVKIDNYDMLVFFSPAGIDSLKSNFPDFKQTENVVIGGFGETTCQAITDAGFTLNFSAPTQTAPSMTMAIEQFLTAENKKNKKK